MESHNLSSSHYITLMSMVWAIFFWEKSMKIFNGFTRMRFPQVLADIACQRFSFSQSIFCSPLEILGIFFWMFVQVLEVFGQLFWSLEIIHVDEAVFGKHWRAIALVRSQNDGNRRIVFHWQVHDLGQFLSHVLWTSGVLKGQIELVLAQDDLLTRLAFIELELSTFSIHINCYVLLEFCHISLPLWKCMAVGDKPSDQSEIDNRLDWKL